MLLLIISVPLLLRAQNDSTEKYYVKDFKLSVKNKTYDFKESYSLTIKKDSIFVRRSSNQYQFGINDLTAIRFRNGSHVVIGLAIGAGLGAALATLLILSGDSCHGEGHPGICFPPSAFALPVMLILTGLGTGIGALIPNYEEYRLRLPNKHDKLIKAIKESSDF